MRLRIIPVKFLFSPPDLVAVPIYSYRQPIENEPLTDDHTQAMIEIQLSGHAGTASV